CRWRHDWAARRASRTPGYPASWHTVMPIPSFQWGWPRPRERIWKPRAIRWTGTSTPWGMRYAGRRCVISARGFGACRCPGMLGLLPAHDEALPGLADERRARIEAPLHERELAC